ncbi:hypothetical protein MJL79_31930, partial [Salmonella enterica subsp. enterica serovar Montevideo]|nr:hypothetical protein [Salmonella enterica subsp. enterica serovar Montevideo]
VEMNKQPNSHGERIISANPSQVICAVIPTNEEKMIALDAIHFSNINTFSTTLSNRVKKQSIACAQNRICPANYKQATFGTFWN